MNEQNDFKYSDESASQNSGPPPVPHKHPGYGRRHGNPQKKSHFGCLVTLLILFGFLFLVIHSCQSFTKDLTVGFLKEQGLTRQEDDKNLSYGKDEYPDFTEVWSSGAGATKVLRIKIKGMISLNDAGGWTSDASSSSTALSSIKRATIDDSINAIILEIDSGGGGITDSDIIYNALLRFKAADSNRVVVAHMQDIAASGAYYISLAADKIIAMPTTITGSIGVILTSYNFRQLAEKIGVSDVSITSGENKSILNPMRDLTTEQTAMLQAIVDKLHSRFVSLVSTHRKIPESRVREIADGRIYLSDQALELGLIDSIGYYEDAVKTVSHMFGVDDIHIIRYEQSRSLMEIFSSPGFWGAAFSRAIPKSISANILELR